MKKIDFINREIAVKGILQKYGKWNGLKDYYSPPGRYFNMIRFVLFTYKRLD